MFAIQTLVVAAARSKGSLEDTVACSDTVEDWFAGDTPIDANRMTAGSLALGQFQVLACYMFSMGHSSDSNKYERQC